MASKVRSSTSRTTSPSTPRGESGSQTPSTKGAGGPWSEDRSNKELDHDSVYRLDPTDDSQWSITRVTFDTTRPNGLLFSLDHTVLYVAQSGRLPEEKRELRAYPVNDDGSLGEGGVIHDFGAHRGIDGMCLDTEGNIIATAGNLVGGPGPDDLCLLPVRRGHRDPSTQLRPAHKLYLRRRGPLHSLRHHRPGTLAKGFHRASRKRLLYLPSAEAWGAGDADGDTRRLNGEPASWNPRLFGALMGLPPYNRRGYNS